MLLKIYSLMVLMLDLLTLLFGIIISIIVAFYRTLRPPAMKSLQGEVAMVIKMINKIFTTINNVN